MWLHPDFQDDAPEPNDEEVEIVDYPETTVYVRTFGGFATESELSACWSGRKTRAAHGHAPYILCLFKARP